MTGSTGFVGSNLLPKLKNEFTVFNPNRRELNLFDVNDLKYYLRNNNIDYIVHSASPSPQRQTGDLKENILGDMLSLFASISEMSSICDKVIYFGSGAEYDKSRSIISAKEDEIGAYIPKDDYGFAKYLMNKMTRNSDNIYNFRLFGCFGPRDYPNKFITHAIRSVILDKQISIRKDCYFDYLHVNDLANTVIWGLSHDLKHHDYNVCSGARMKLSEIAQIVITEMNSNQTIRILDDSGFANEYTGSNGRLINEMSKNTFSSIVEGIRSQIAWEFENWSEDVIFDGE